MFKDVKQDPTAPKWMKVGVAAVSLFYGILICGFIIAVGIIILINSAH